MFTKFWAEGSSTTNNSGALGTGLQTSSGTASITYSFGTYTLTDSTKTWIPSQWVNAQVNIGGTPYTVTTNTSTSMTLTGTRPTGSQPYSISRTYAPLVVTTSTPGQYYIQTNWGNNGAVGCASTSSRTAFLYSIENGGAAQYLLVSVNYLGALNGWEFDTVTGGATITEPATCYGGVPVSCLVTPVAIPGLTISNTVNNGNGTYTLTLTWTAISNLQGYYDTAPTNNIITGLAVRYNATDSSSAPTDFSTASYPLATNGFINWGLSGTDPGTATVTIPAPDDERPIQVSGCICTL